ncbi:MAG: type III PLP-dependent enzyme [Victivallales bacterium]|nr:type III PLP-dependent enzyme [Victivallales bacterium]
MKINVKDYFNDKQWRKIKRVADRNETPFLVVNLDVIRQRWDELKQSMPYAKIYYAVKANPAKEVLELLRDLGSCFDVASVYELRKVLSLGVEPERISYGNTIKKAHDIREFYNAGVRLYVTDSEGDLRNIAKEAPGAKIFVRILAEGVFTADWPLSRKFGCQPDMAFDLLELAKKLKLQPYGVSFHVGSQQRDISAWDAAIAKVKLLFDWCRDSDIELKSINMGGGLPAQYIDKNNTIDTYSSEITRFLHEDFEDDIPEIIIEPGRSMVGDCGVIVSEVVLISRKSRTALERWVYTDVGKFNGLMETLDESIKYPVYVEKEGPREKVIIAGPTCDSVDTIYEEAEYTLPLNLSVGDRMYWLSTGAYTSSYCAVDFNGFPPLRTIFI